MAPGAPQPLDAGHPIDAFDCGNPALNEWLIRHARQAQASGSARTYVVVDDQRIAGYFSLAVGQIDSLDAPERVRKGMGNYPIPVVILARLAVAMVDQGRGLGVGLLQDAIRRTLAVADQAGVRALLTHPIDEAAARFYLRFGFEASPAREQQLILLLKDARRLLLPTSTMAGKAKSGGPDSNATRSTRPAPRAGGAVVTARHRPPPRVTAVRMPRRISIGGGGQPGTATSTGMMSATRPQLA
jgi:GNAT superfamily N-acetyltransferase